MDYKEAYYNLIGQIDDTINILEDKYLPIFKAIEDLKSILLKIEDNFIKGSEDN